MEIERAEQVARLDVARDHSEKLADLLATAFAAAGLQPPAGLTPIYDERVLLDSGAAVLWGAMSGHQTLELVHVLIKYARLTGGLNAFEAAKLMTQALAGPAKGEQPEQASDERKLSA